MKNIVLVSLLYAAIFSSCASSKPDAKTLRTLAEMKENGLVIWLPDSKRRLEYFKSKGWSKDATKEQAEIEKGNRELVGYYKAHFDFCKVNFYYTSLEEDLRNGIPVLLNADMKPDASISLPKKIILGGFYYRDDIEHSPYMTRQFWVENSKIKMKLVSESFSKPRNVKIPYPEYDIIRLNKKLAKMATQNNTQ